MNCRMYASKFNITAPPKELHVPSKLKIIIGNYDCNSDWALPEEDRTFTLEELKLEIRRSEQSLFDPDLRGQEESIAADLKTLRTAYQMLETHETQGIGLKNTTISNLRFDFGSLGDFYHPNYRLLEINGEQIVRLNLTKLCASIAGGADHYIDYDLEGLDRELRAIRKELEKKYKNENIEKSSDYKTLFAARRELAAAQNDRDLKQPPNP